MKKHIWIEKQEVKIIIEQLQKWLKLQETGILGTDYVLFLLDDKTRPNSLYPIVPFIKEENGIRCISVDPIIYEQRQWNKL